MAGYLFLLSEHSIIADLVKDGAYSTNMTNPTNGIWSAAMEGTIADYATMKEGDNVYFFSKRKIYGIGEIVKINNAGFLQNFPEAILPINAHVRPHAQNANDTYPLPVADKLTGLTDYTKHCFWINASYVRDEIYLKN